jgi:hypothetical protein
MGGKIAAIKSSSCAPNSSSPLTVRTQPDIDSGDPDVACKALPLSCLAMADPGANRARTDAPSRQTRYDFPSKRRAVNRDVAVPGRATRGR